MGIDIHGWVEVWSDSGWQGVIRIDALFVADSGMYGCLFGVGEKFGFRPIIEVRGLPEDVSDQVKGDAWVSMSEAHTWITLLEINTIDWDEQSPTLTRKQIHSEVVERRFTRREVLELDRQWQFMFELMGLLGKRYSDERIRLIVYFDR